MNITYKHVLLHATAANLDIQGRKYNNNKGDFVILRGIDDVAAALDWYHVTFHRS